MYGEFFFLNIFNFLISGEKIVALPWNKSSNTVLNEVWQCQTSIIKMRLPTGNLNLQPLPFLKGLLYLSLRNLIESHLDTDVRIKENTYL